MHQQTPIKVPYVEYITVKNTYDANDTYVYDHYWNNQNGHHYKILEL